MQVLGTGLHGPVLGLQQVLGTRVLQVHGSGFQEVHGPGLQQVQGTRVQKGQDYTKSLVHVYYRTT